MATTGPQLTRISHYRVLEQIGAGGMGMVFRALDERLSREVAVKVLPPAGQADEAARKRFRTEAGTLIRLNHPNIATLFDFGVETVDGREVDYLVMELIAGTTLNTQLERGSLPLDEALSLSIQMMKGLAAAHEQKVLHRDLKPANLRVTPDGHLKILDFGLAKLVNQETVESETQSLGLTQAGSVMGTMPYMAPEQLRSETCDFRADLYSAGAVLYEMVTGRRPFPQGGAQLTNAILNEQPSVPSALNRSIEPALDTIILKALEKKPSLRYQSAREMLVDLERLRSGKHTAVRAGRGIAGGRRLVVAGVVLAIVVLSALASVPVVRHFFKSRPAATSNDVKTLAVLPLKPIGAEATNDFLGLGLTDSIINKLSGTQLLIVRPFSTVRRFATSDKDSISAARELDVDTVLDGTVQKSGAKLRVAVNLLRASDGSSVWADTFDVQSDDIFAVQEQVAAQVVEKLGRTLKPDTREAINKRYTSSPEAYANFVKASYYMGQITAGPSAEGALDKAEGFFTRAIDLDPNYAQARAELAYLYVWRALFVDLRPEWIERARAELAVAEKQDPSLAAIHAVRHQLAWSKYGGFDLREAGQELRKAQAIDPGGNSGALAIFYGHLGISDLAEQALTGADRYSPEDAASNRIESDWLLGNYEEAVKRCTEQSKGNPCPPTALARVGRLSDAMRAVENELKQNPGHPQWLSTKAVILATMGKQKEANELIARTLVAAEQNRGFHHVAFDAACIYASTGRKPEAVKMLRAAAEKGMPDLLAFRNDPFLKSLQGYAPYEQFMAEQKIKWDAYHREFTLPIQ